MALIKMESNTGKLVSYRGVKATLPNNVSINAFKQIVGISAGFDNVVQPFLDLLSRQLLAAKLQERNGIKHNQL